MAFMLRGKVLDLRPDHCPNAEAALTRAVRGKCLRRFAIVADLVFSLRRAWWSAPFTSLCSVGPVSLKTEPNERHPELLPLRARR